MPFCLHEFLRGNLEMAYGLDTNSFLNAFYRMTTHRGFPTQVISDNGTNFVGAERELCDLVNTLDEKKIQESTVNRGVVWKFNPPLAPHFNGLHEVLINEHMTQNFLLAYSKELSK